MSPIDQDRLTQLNREIMEMKRQRDALVARDPTERGHVRHLEGSLAILEAERKRIQGDMMVAMRPARDGRAGQAR